MSNEVKPDGVTLSEEEFKELFVASAPEKIELSGRSISATILVERDNAPRCIFIKTSSSGVSLDPHKVVAIYDALTPHIEVCRRYLVQTEGKR